MECLDFLMRISDICPAKETSCCNQEPFGRLFHREWNGELKKLPNIKMRKVSPKGLEKKHTAVKETHADDEACEEDINDDDDDEDDEASQDSDAERLEDKA